MTKKKKKLGSSKRRSVTCTSKMSFDIEWTPGSRDFTVSCDELHSEYPVSLDAIGGEIESMVKEFIMDWEHERFVFINGLRSDYYLVVSHALLDPEEDEWLVLIKSIKKQVEEGLMDIEFVVSRYFGGSSKWQAGTYYTNYQEALEGFTKQLFDHNPQS